LHVSDATDAKITSKNRLHNTKLHNTVANSSGIRFYHDDQNEIKVLEFARHFHRTKIAQNKNFTIKSQCYASKNSSDL